MQNSQRPADNPALDQAISLANEHGVGVTVYLALDTTGGPVRMPLSGVRAARVQVEFGRPADGEESA